MFQAVQLQNKITSNSELNLQNLRL